MNAEIAVVRPQRIPRHLLVAGSAWVSRIVTALVQLASVRILTNSLGLEKFAVITLLTGLSAWFTLANCGAGLSLQNYISESRAKNLPYNEMTFACLVFTFLLLPVAGLILYFLTPVLAPVLLQSFKCIDEPEKCRLFFASGLISISVGVGQILYNIWYAEQKGYFSNIVPAVASLAGFLGLVLVSHSPSVDKTFLSLVSFTLPSALIPLVGLGVKIKLQGKSTTEQVFATMLMILKRGFKFWLFALMSIGVLQVDYIVISQILGSHELVVYSLSTRIFGVLAFMYTAVLLSLWPILAELIVKADWEGIKRYMRKYMALGFVLIFLGTVMLIPIMPYLISILSPKEYVRIPVVFIILLGCYQMIRVWTDTFAALLQSMSDLRPFWIFVPIQAALSSGLQWILAPYLGINGIVLGLICSFLFTVSWGLPMFARKYYLLSMK
jgi:O-antigen/teichoic acid export membrane protein